MISEIKRAKKIPRDLIQMQQQQNNSYGVNQVAQATETSRNLPDVPVGNPITDLTAFMLVLVVFVGIVRK